MFVPAFYLFQLSGRRQLAVRGNGYSFHTPEAFYVEGANRTSDYSEETKFGNQTSATAVSIVFEPNSALLEVFFRSLEKGIIS